VVYARVSTVEQREEGYSLDAQMALLREYALKKGFNVAREYLDADSGAKQGRSFFGQMVEDVRGLGSDCAIVCEKTDRLYRNFADMVKVDELGVELHFVKENIVVGPDSRSNDKFIHSIKVCLAKHFSDNLREEVKKGMTEKAKQGIFPSMAPIGYINTVVGHRKVIAPDPQMAPLVRQVFEAYARKEVSIEGAAKLAKNLGLKTRAGHSYARSSISRMLENPVYMGIVRWSGEDYPGIHEPIVSPELFHEVQRVMHGRTTRSGFTVAHEFAYRGLMTCAFCGCSITAEIKKGKYIYYRCTGMRDKKCPGMQVVREEVLTEQFASLLEGLVLSEENLESLKIALKESLADEAEMRRANMERIASESASIRAKLERMYMDRIEDKVSEAVYDSLRKKLTSELAGLDVQMHALDKAEGSYYDLGLKLLELAQTAPLRFLHADSDTRHSILLELLDRAELKERKVQVWLKEPFDTLLQRNVERLAQGPETALEEDWYSRRDSNPRSSP
jgi:site-specific DNA recombinase